MKGRGSANTAAKIFCTRTRGSATCGAIAVKSPSRAPSAPELSPNSGELFVIVVVVVISLITNTVRFGNDLP